MATNREKRFARLGLAAILLLDAFLLRGEFSASRLDHNDSLDHFLFVQGMVRAITHGGNPLDWPMDGPFGYPVVRDYQPLAHMLVALLYFALGKAVPLLTVFAAVRWLAMVLLPLTFYAAARWLELPRFTALAAAGLAPLAATSGLYGIEYESYTWLGYGLFAQAVAVHLLLLSLGLGFRAIRRGRGMALAGVLLGLTFCAQFVYGYIGALTLCLTALLPGESAMWRRVARTAAVGAVAAMVAAFQLLPLVADGRLINPAAPGERWKVDSYGAAAVLKAFCTAQLLDHGRLPVLSLLALAGVAALAWRWRRKRQIAGAELLALAGTLLWTLLLFGRPTWGAALGLLGVTPDLPLHRVVAAVQIFGVLLAGAGLSFLCGAICRRWTSIAAAAAAILLLAPAVWERIQYLESSRNARLEYAVAIGIEQSNLDSVVAAVRARGGYVYAGQESWQAFRIGGWPLYLYLMGEDVPQVSYSDHVLELPWSMFPVWKDIDPAQYRLFNIQSTILPPLTGAAPAFLTPRLAAGRFHVYDAPGAGMFDVVDALAAVPADRQSFFAIDSRWLASPLVAQRGHLLLDFFGTAPAGLPHMDAAGALPADPYADSPGSVSTERDGGDSFQAAVTAARAAFVLFRVTWHQNWKATVDGAPVPTFMLSPGFIGVPVTAGAHRVAFHYRPDAWRLWLALAGLAIAMALAAMESVASR